MIGGVRVCIQGRPGPAPDVPIVRTLAVLAACGLAKGWTPARAAEVALRAVGDPAEHAELRPRLRIVDSEAGLWDLVLHPWPDPPAARAE